LRIRLRWKKWGGFEGTLIIAHAESSGSAPSPECAPVSRDFLPDESDEGLEDTDFCKN
jgi:hypothetical protein